MSELRRYGQWAGNERGQAEDPSRCIESVMHGYLFHQCSRKRGHGPDGLRCKQHANAIEALRPVDPLRKGGPVWNSISDWHFERIDDDKVNAAIRAAAPAIVEYERQKGEAT